VFGEPWPNTVYTVHDYALPGLYDSGAYPGPSRGIHVDRDVIERTFLARTEYMRRTGTPIWVGEFGPVYPGDARRDAMRRQVLADQLAIYPRHDAGWALWTYKDIGLQGLVCASPDSPYLRRIRPVLERKARLGASSRPSTRFRSVSAPGSTVSSAISCWPNQWSRISGAASKGWTRRRRKGSRIRSSSPGA
jgi:endoglucanase